MRRATIRSAIAGSVLAILLSYPVVLTWAALGGEIDVPFRGRVSGREAVELSFGTVLMIGIAGGGFLVLAVAGAVTGALIQWKSRTDSLRWWRLLAACLILDVALFAVFVACG